MSALTDHTTEWVLQDGTSIDVDVSCTSDPGGANQAFLAGIGTVNAAGLMLKLGHYHDVDGTAHLVSSPSEWTECYSDATARSNVLAWINSYTVGLIQVGWEMIRTNFGSLAQEGNGSKLQDWDFTTPPVLPGTTVSLHTALETVLKSECPEWESEATNIDAVAPVTPVVPTVDVPSNIFNLSTFRYRRERTRMRSRGG